jgi:hypothetical protein
LLQNSEMALMSINPGLFVIFGKYTDLPCKNKNKYLNRHFAHSQFDFKITFLFS